MVESMRNWHEYLATCERDGHSLREIQKELVGRGYEPKFIRNLIQDYKRHSRQQWDEYLDTARDCGHSYKNIKHHLVHNKRYHERTIQSLILRHRVKKASIVATPLVALLLLISGGLFALLNPEGLTGYSVSGDGGTIGTVNFSKSIGIVNQYFYGVNTQGIWGSEYSYIDSNNDGTLNTNSDYVWHRLKIAESGIKYIRADMNLDEKYYSMQNGNYENWNNINSVKTFGNSAFSNPSDVPIGWQITSMNYQNVEATVSRTTDAQAGTYATHIMANYSGPASIRFYYPTTTLAYGRSYTFSVWAKSASSNTLTIKLQRQNDFVNECSSTKTLTNAYTQINCTVTPQSQISPGYQIIIENQQNSGSADITIDSARLTREGKDYIWLSNNLSNTRNINRDRSNVEWAHQNNMKMLYTVGYMPQEFANITGDCAAEPKFCSPKDPAVFAEIVKDFIDDITLNGTYIDSIDIEVWNEPDNNYWLKAVPRNDPKRVALYNQMYQAIYSNLKNAYPRLTIAGPGIADVANNSAGQQFYRAWIAANSQQLDSFNFHKYIFGSDFDTQLSGHLQAITADCMTYNARCSRITLSEYNVGSLSMQFNNDAEYAKQIALALAYGLNNYPENMSMILYDWAEYTKYQSGTYYSYPYRYTALSEPSLDNAHYPPYNVTKDFSKYHPAGSTTMQSSSTDPIIRIIASKKDNENYISVINGYSSAKQINLTITGVNASSLTDLTTGATIAVSNGFVNLGAIQGASIKHYNITLQVAPPPPVLDITAPIVTLTSPTDTAILSTLNVPFTWTASDNGATVINCAVIIDGTAQANVVVQNATVGMTTLALSEATHTWKVSCSDNASNTGTSATRTFATQLPPPPPIIDTTPPIITLLAPPNNLTSASTDVQFAWSANDNAALAVDCAAYIDGVNQGTTVVQNDTQVTITNTLTEATHDWEVICTDNSSNTATSATRTLIVQLPPPPQNGTEDNSSNSTNVTQPPLNVAPATPVLVLTSADNTTNSDLLCTITASDPDADTLNVTVSWYRNNTSENTLLLPFDYPSGSTLVTIKQASALGTGDSWQCGATATDGQLNSVEELSNTVSITSPPPANTSNNTTAPPQNDHQPPSTSNSGGKGGGGGGGGLPSSSKPSTSGGSTKPSESPQGSNRVTTSVPTYGNITVPTQSISEEASTQIEQSDKSKVLKGKYWLISVIGLVSTVALIGLSSYYAHRRVREQEEQEAYSASTQTALGELQPPFPTEQNLAPPPNQLLLPQNTPPQP